MSLSIINQSQTRVFGLDLLRFIAIVLVVILHGSGIVQDNFPGFIDLWAFDGVDIFFVLSGFLIGRILIKEFSGRITKSTFINFWKRRWFRTLPLYYIVLLLALLVTWFTMVSFNGFYPGYFLFLQNFNRSQPSFFTVSWSLSVEEWFYILFPVVIALTSFVTKNFRTVLLFTILIFILVPLAYRLKKGMFFVYGQPPEFYIWDRIFRRTVTTRLDTISFGVLGAYLQYYHARFFQNYKGLKALVGVGLVALATAIPKDSYLFYTIYFDIISLGVLLCLPFFYALKSGHKWVAYPVTYVSLISYSMYLLHHTIILQLILALKPYSDRVAITLYISYYLLTILLSSLSFRFIEHPATQLRDKF